MSVRESESESESDRLTSTPTLPPLRNTAPGIHCGLSPPSASVSTVHCAFKNPSLPPGNQVGACRSIAFSRNGVLAKACEGSDCNRRLCARLASHFA